MDSSVPVPSQSEDARRGSPRQYSTRRVDTRPHLVDRIPVNPKIIAFESTQHRFEVPLRPELWSSYAAVDGHVSPLQQPPNQPVRQKSSVPDDSTRVFMDDDHAHARKKSNRRKRNVSDDRTGDGIRRRKKLGSSHRYSKERNIALDKSKRLTDYFPAKEGTQSMRSSRTFRCAADVGAVGSDDMTDVPPLHIPRMCDLLSQPLGYLTGRPLQAFHELFDQFDRTFSDNINAIQSSLSNIVRAHLLLAERCRPVIEGVIATLRSLSDPSIIGESSRRNNQGEENDFADVHHVFEPGTSASRNPNIANIDDITREDSEEHRYSPDPALAPSPAPPLSTTFQREACGEGNAHNNASDTLQSSSTSSDSNHNMDNLNSLLGAVHAEKNTSTSHTVHMPRSVQYDNHSNNPHNRACPSHTSESNLIREESAQQADDRYTNNVSGTLYGPKPRAGKRFTWMPARYCSPFKAGIMSRPPPNRDAAMNLREHLCAEDSPLRRLSNVHSSLSNLCFIVLADCHLCSTTVIKVGTTPLTGALIARSFVDDAFPNSIFMKGFVKCIIYDDYFIRPECHGYRIFFDSDISAILNVEWINRDTSVPQYSEAAAIAAIQRCLPFTNLKKTKMILLPVLHNHHWSVYCVNFSQSRIDVLDSMDHMSDGDNSWEFHHSDMGKTIIQ